MGRRPTLIPTTLSTTATTLLFTLLLLPLPTTSIPILHPRAQIFAEPGDFICRPAEWNDILLFFLLNYVTHAFTLKSYPGDGLLYSIPLNVLSLLFPYAGILKAWDSIRLTQLREKSDLGRAKSAGALCVVGRADDWRPEGGERVWCWNKAVDRVTGGRVGTWQSVLNEGRKEEKGEAAAEKKGWFGFGGGNKKQIRKSKSIEENVRERAAQAKPKPHFRIEMQDPHELIPLNPDHVCIHGQFHLPPGYRMLTLPRNIPVKPLNTSIDPPNLANSHNIPKSLASIVQLFYAAATLYRARGDQLDRYGFAAYSLTVIPFMLMSLLNLISHIFTPDFPAVYLVRSPIMAEAERRGGTFDGMIGEVDTEILESEDTPASVPGFPVQFKAVESDSAEENSGEAGTANGSIRTTGQTVIRAQTPHPLSTDGPSDEKLSGKEKEKPQPNDSDEYASSADIEPGVTTTTALRTRRSFVVSLDPAVLAAEREEAARAEAAALEASANSDNNGSSSNGNGSSANNLKSKLGSRSRPSTRRKGSSERITPQTVFEALVDLPEAVVRAPQKSDSWLKRIIKGGRRDSGRRQGSGFSSLSWASSGKGRGKRKPRIFLSSLGLPPLDENSLRIEGEDGADNEKKKGQSTPFFHKKYASGTLVAILMLLPYLAIYFLTHFQPRQSTRAQQGWTMAWLGAGQIVGIGMVGVWKDWRNLGRVGGWGSLVMLGYAVPAIGGWVVVGGMIREYGVCDVVD